MPAIVEVEEETTQVTQPEEPYVDPEFDTEDPAELSEDDAAFVHRMVLKIIQFTENLCDITFHEYQREVAYRVIESVVINDGKIITVLQARQSGKSAVLGSVITGMMVLLPRLAKAYPALLGRFAKGFTVGVFAPTESQAETVWNRVYENLTSDEAKAMFAHPELEDRATRSGSKTRVVQLTKSGSLCRMQTANAKAKIESKTYHFVLVDECFPYETPVLTSEGLVPIGDIVNGGNKKWLVATQGADGGLEWGYVRTGYKTPRYNELLRVDHEHGSVYATANHPFMVGGQAVPASALSPGTVLSLVQGADQPGPRGARQASVPSVLHEQLSGDVSQLDGFRRYQEADERNIEEDWTPPQGAGRQWSGHDRATAQALAASAARLGSRVCLPYWRAEEGRGAFALQDRSGESTDNGGRGSGRGFTQLASETGAGPAQDLMAYESRVVRVEVLQPGSAEFDQFSDRADYVYTLEVDSASHTYVAGGVLVGNCQEVDSDKVKKSIGPMLASTNGSRVYTGTPSRVKNIFYEQCRRNKLNWLNAQGRRGAKRNHFEYTYKTVIKYNPDYKKYIATEKAELGEDSDEYQMSYNCKWMLDQGMFVTEERLNTLGDVGMNVMPAWWRSPVVVGIDPARTHDSTVVTVVWVDWDHPDAFGYREHRILNWKEIHNKEWEEQYAIIANFLANYNVMRIGVDAQGMGGPVAERLKLFFPDVDVQALTSDPKNQAERWKHLKTLIERERLVFPAHSKTRRLKSWQKFHQQMTDLQTAYSGRYMMAVAPDERNAFDDYADSLALACYMTVADTMPAAEQFESPFAGVNRR